MKNVKRAQRQTLEHEIITAVVMLYLMIAVVMIVVHYIQPERQGTMTSSVSPSHREQSVHY